MNSGRLLTIKGYAAHPGEGWPIASNYLVQGNYFDALRIPLLAGRFFNSADDTAHAPLTAIVSQTFASHYWPHQNAVGKELKVGTVDNPMPWITVVGVVGDVKQDAVDKATTIEMYEPMAQAQRDLGSYGTAMGPYGNGRIVVRTAQDPSAVAESIRRAVRELDPLLPLSHIETLDSVLSRTEAPRRFDTYVFATFAGIALFLSLLGMYGVIASVVNEQTRSIAIRMALGATRESILGRTIASALALAGMGLVIGLCAALGLGRFMSSLLYGVTPQDPAALGAAVVLLLLCALLAGLIPARRAAAINLIELMRSE
jgi:putative ABC transport system permease protein